MSNKHGKRASDNVDFFDSDEALGEVLGSTIKARVDAPVVNPPVSLIAKRAQAQARAKTVQRTVVGIAASVSLLAGGIFAVNALDNSSGVTTTPDFAANDDLNPPNINENVSSDPAAVATFSWEEVNEQDLFAGLRNSSDVDLVVGNPTTVGDGRVFVVTTSNSEQFINVSDNGSDWTQITVPTDVSVETVDISGDRWLVAGPDKTSFDGLNRAYYSDNGGTDWTEVGFGDAANENLATADLMRTLVSGEDMVFVYRFASQSTDMASLIDELIRGSGLLPNGAEIGMTLFEGNTISFSTTADPDPLDSLVSFTISEEQIEVLEGSRVGAHIKVFASKGDHATMTGQYSSSHTTGYSNEDGFHIAITTDTNELLLSSVDGIDWDETSIDKALDPTELDLYGTYRSDEWFVTQRNTSNGLLLEVQSLGEVADDNTVTAMLANTSHLTSLDVGPSVMIAIANPADELLADPSQPDQLLGWSTNGSDWQWQTLTEVFGVDKVNFGATVYLGVGSDYVIARVEQHLATNESPTLEAQPRISWFKATLT